MSTKSKKNKRLAKRLSAVAAAPSGSVIASLRNDVRLLRSALRAAEDTLQFWIEHNREMENPMLTAGTRSLQTMRVIKATLENSQNE